MNNKISKQKMKEFEDKIKKFQYLRKNRVSFYQGIFIAFLTSAIVLFINLISPQDIFLQILLILLLLFLALESYNYMLKQTQKPVVVAENAIGTIETHHTIKGNDGKDYVVFAVSDFIHKGDKK